MESFDFAQLFRDFSFGWLNPYLCNHEATSEPGALVSLLETNPSVCIPFCKLVEPYPQHPRAARLPKSPWAPPIPWVPWLCRRPRRVTPHRCACGASARAASSRGTLQISHLCMKSCLPRASSRMLPLSAGRANSPSASVIPGRLLTPGSLRRWLCVISVCSADRPCPEQPPGSPYPLQCLQRLKITL